VRVLPSSSRLSAEQADAYYSESYEVPLSRSDLKMHEIYDAIFEHLPWWGRALIVLRNFVVSPFGLRTEPAAKVWRPVQKGSYAPGDKIGRFTLYAIDENEVVAGGDDKHLDFRVSVMRLNEKGARNVVVSTLIFVHNLFGKIYLAFVLPLHRFGMQRLLADAVKHRRI
jgi:Protein of unknown function (DUF2867)